MQLYVIKGVNFAAYTMKKALSYIMFLLFALCISQVTLYAQDGHDYNHANGYDDGSSEMTPDTFNDPEGKVVNSTTKPHVAKDSSAVRTPPQRNKSNQETPPPVEVKPQSPPPQSGSEDDILSFNFLYYIIQKFKLQDIIE